MLISRQEDSLVFMATGDILLGGPVQKEIDIHGYDYLLSGVAPVLRSGDLVLANLEGPVAASGHPVKKRFRFRMAPDALAALREAGVNMVTLANNHTLDYGRVALADTFENLRCQGIDYMGAGHNEKEANQPLIINKNNLRIGFLAYTVFPTYGVSHDPRRVSVARPLKQSLVRQRIKQLKSQVDLVIVSFHWGWEFHTKPSVLQRQWAHIAINAGADLILGHHPHVLQTRERYKGKLIVYSLGNFVFYMTEPETCKSTIFKCRLTKNGAEDVEFIPVNIRNYRPELASG